MHGSRDSSAPTLVIPFTTSDFESVAALAVTLTPFAIAAGLKISVGE